MTLRRSRWRLTVAFTAVQLVTFVLFAWGVYSFVTSAFDIDGSDESSAVPTAEAGFATLRTALLIALASLMIVAPATSWALAGVALRPVAATLAAQRRFVDDASHELRTPLTAIQAQLELVLRRPRTEAEYRAACATALEAAHALGAVSEDLLLAADENYDRASGEPVDLGESAGRARDLLSDPSRVHITQTGSPRVSGPASAIERILVNLLVNAEKYSPLNAPIRIRVDASRRWGLIEIEDAGRGMSRAEVRRAFDRFWQADSSRADQGSGLGLAIVHELVESLHGRIALSSEPGTGTVARVRLPLSRSSHGRFRSFEPTEPPVRKEE
ncbi:MAG: sensor histidine kinase [Microbacterium sp.]